jgi:ribosomal protein L40E
MLIILEIALFIGAIVRGWVVGAIIALILLFVAQVAMVELSMESKGLSTIIEIIFILSLILMIVFPKKRKKHICTKCNSAVSKDDFKCKTCGKILKNITPKEIITKDKYSLIVFLQRQEDFVKIKNKIMEQYKPIGYNKESINKEDSIMLTSDTIEKSYISAKIKEHEVSIESFRAEKPNIKVDEKGCVIE